MLSYFECILKSVKSGSLEILQYSIALKVWKCPKPIPEILSEVKNTNTLKFFRTRYFNFNHSKNRSRSAVSVFQSGNGVRYPAITPLNKWPCIENRSIHIDQTGWARSINSGPSISINERISTNEYEVKAEETLESLTTYFDEIVEKSELADSDVTYSSGVLSIKLGKHGTYVINKQTPNKQIWLSSPTSGPKRYDFINNTWIYKHDGQSMYNLLNSEIPKLVGVPGVDFAKNCSFGRS